MAPQVLLVVMFEQRAKSKPKVFLAVETGEEGSRREGRGGKGGGGGRGVKRRLEIAKENFDFKSANKGLER